MIQLIQCLKINSKIDIKGAVHHQLLAFIYIIGEADKDAQKAIIAGRETLILIGKN